MTQILIVGGASFNTMIALDRFPEPQPQTLIARGFHETIGSTGAGKALNLRKLGMGVTLHAPIGDDRYGRLIADGLAAAGVTFLYDLDPAGTQRHVNLMDRDGRRISLFLVPGTFDLAFDRVRLEAHIRTCDYLVLNISNYCRTLIPAIRQQQKAIWCDIHDYDGANSYHQDFIEAADYLFLSSEALPDYRQFMAQQVARGKRLVVCTHGKRGATALSPAGEWIETPIVSRYSPVDTNGAGDAFVAGVLYGHTQGYRLRECLRLGAVVGGLCVTSAELAADDLSPARVAAEYLAEYGEALGIGSGGVGLPGPF